jgi:fructokinase
VIILAISPSKILIGGGVGLGHRGLLNRARPALLERLAGYLPGVNAASVGTLVEHAGLGSDAGPLGAIALGHLALDGVASVRDSRDTVQ